MARERLPALCSSFLLALAVASLSSTSVEAAQPVSEAVTGQVTTRELVELGELEGLAVAPDGSHVVVRVDRQNVSNNSSHSEWRVVRIGDAKVVAIVDAGPTQWGVNGGFAPAGPTWSPDSQSFYFRKITGETVQIWRAARDGSGLTQVTDDAADIAIFFVDEAGLVHYAVGPASREEIKAAERAEYENGVLLDEGFITGFKAANNFPVNGRMATLRFSSRAKWFGRAGILGEGPLRFRTISPEGRVVTGDAGVARRLEELWSATSGNAAVADPAQGSGGYYAPLGQRAQLGKGRKDDRPRKTYHSAGRYISWIDAKGTETACSHKLCRDFDYLSVVGWANKGRELIFQSETLGDSKLNSWNIRTNAVRTLYAQEGALGYTMSGRGGHCALTADEAICIAASAANPPKLIAVRLATGRSRLLLDPNADIPASRLATARIIEVQDKQGSSALATLLLPRDWKPGRRLPLVISSYSCNGFLQGGSGQDVPEHVYAGKGYAAACLDTSSTGVRRVTGFVYEHGQVESSALGFSQDLIRILDEERIIDPRRVMLTGYSGSTVSTAYAITHSNTFTAVAVMTGGWGDVIGCYLSSHRQICAEIAKKEGEALPYDRRDGRLLELSPAWKADKITAPLLMQLPEAEYVGMMQLYGAMLEYGRAVEMRIFPDAFHYKNNPRQRLAVYDRNFDWAEFWLRGKESGLTGDSEQYTRWRAMREKQCQLFGPEGTERHVRPNGHEHLADDELIPWYCRPGALSEVPH